MNDQFTCFNALPARDRRAKLLGLYQYRVQHRSVHSSRRIFCRCLWFYFYFTFIRFCLFSCHFTTLL